MKTLNDFLREKGFRLYMCSLDQRYLSFVSEENYCVNVVCCFDERHATSTAVQMQAFLDAHKGPLSYGRGKDIHFLKLVCTNALGVGRLIPGVDGHGVEESEDTQEDSSWVDQVWYVIDDANTDPETGGSLGVRLFVPPEAPEDFYGLRGALDSQLKENGLYMQLPELNIDEAGQTHSAIDRAPAVQGPDGRPVIRSTAQPSDKELSWVTLGLVLVNALMYILSSMQIFDTDDYGLTLDIMRSSGQWYRLFSYMFLHASLPHLAGNMLMLYAGGSMMEERMHRGAFFGLYVLSGLGGGLLSVIQQFRRGEEYISIGASGAIYGIMGGLIAWMLLKREWKSIQFYNRILIALLLLFYGGSLDSGIDYMAHLGGFLTGLLSTGLYIIITWKGKRSLRNERKQ
ncbi:MAG: rhomboid family intramembrane serine protease [Lachnospiraceae bacterium]|nr:rhomboid family intramembrane serine protease [Lachnospiraceae bacterium]